MAKIVPIDARKRELRPITVSVGVAALTGREGETMESLVRRADEALYEAKRTGRDKVVLASTPSAA
jgi:two-component system cell cycle response regulator